MFQSEDCQAFIIIMSTLCSPLYYVSSIWSNTVAFPGHRPACHCLQYGGGLGMRLGSPRPVRAYQIGVNPAGLEDWKISYVQMMTQRQNGSVSSQAWATKSDQKPSQQSWQVVLFLGPLEKRKRGSGKWARMEVYTVPGMQAHLWLAFD